MAAQKKTKIVRASEVEIEVVGSKKHFWYSKPGLTDTARLHYVRVTLPPGEGHDFHYHPMEEVLHILAGSAEQWVAEERHLLGPGDALHLPEGVIHATFNCGEDLLEFIAVLIPDRVDYEGEMTVEVGDQEPWSSIRKKSV